jgi:hypothetical protein
MCSPACLHWIVQALIVPVIHRGLRDRMGDTKKRAARIAGNMASLVNDPKVREQAGRRLGWVGDDVLVNTDSCHQRCW